MEALSYCLPPTHLSTLARTSVKEKQVLVDKEPTVSSDPLQDLTECKLVTKTNEALTVMTTQVAGHPSNPRAVSVKKL